MRPRILLAKGEKPAIPPIRTELSPARASRVTPKPVDDFMDKVMDVKDLTGRVIFTGTPRQWQRWASQREEDERARCGMLPKKKASHSRRCAGK